MSERKRYVESEWLYATARVRALERALPDQSAIERLLDARDAAEICSMCAESGLKLDPANTEKGLHGFIDSVYAETAETAPDADVLNVSRLPYDAHNVKTAIKCSIVSRDPKPLMIGNGTLPIDIVAEAVETRSFERLPKNIGEAAGEALEVWAKTRDPQYIDQLIDAGCVLDKKEIADAYGDRFISGLVEYESDLTNVLTCIRILRMTGEGADTEYLERMLLPCGTLGKDFFVSAYNDGEPALWAKLAGTRYSVLASSLDASGSYSLSSVERETDNIRTGYIKSARFILAGAPALISYIFTAEQYVKNVRIILAGKNAGESAETIKERLRGLNV